MAQVILENIVKTFDNTEVIHRVNARFENGEFVVAKLSTGTYKLQVHYNGMKNYIEGNYNLDNWYDGTTDFNDAVPIDVTISDTTKNIIINLREGGKISGSVKNYNGEPINDGCEISVFLEKQDVRPYS